MADLQDIEVGEGKGCPSCGQPLQLITDGLVGREHAVNGVLFANRPIPIRMEPLPFWACSTCEFCEINWEA